MKSLIIWKPGSYLFMKEVLLSSGFNSINFRLLFLQLLKVNIKII